MRNRHKQRELKKLDKQREQQLDAKSALDFTDPTPKLAVANLIRATKRKG